VPRQIPYSTEQFAALGLDPQTIPRHVAIIMDGNGRWAKARGLPRIEGHRRGVNSVRRTVEECCRLGVEQLTLYCFSTENWKRPRLELDLLMSLLKHYVIAERELIMEQDIRLCAIGRIEELHAGILKELKKTCEVSAGNQGMRLCLALNYGSRQEIVDAIQRIATDVEAGKLKASDIDEAQVASHLDTAGMPDPDLLIRTSGEMRLSNFLLWQISYAELVVTQTHWPDFDVNELHSALKEYAGRDRRFGGLKE
jgi:undecaprenyl diphosphate synthase